VPFLYYIGKEQFLMAYDEYHNRSISLMVERVINEQGDPRFYLAQLKKNTQQNIQKGAASKIVFLHRLPHMKLGTAIRSKINCCLFSCMVFATAVGLIYLQFFDKMFGLITSVFSAFELFIIPGLFYFLKNKTKWLREDFNGHMFIIYSRKQEKAIRKNPFSDLLSCCFKSKRGPRRIDNYDFDTDSKDKKPMRISRHEAQRLKRVSMFNVDEVFLQTRSTGGHKVSDPSATMMPMPTQVLSLESVDADMQSNQNQGWLTNKRLAVVGAIWASMGVAFLLGTMTTELYFWATRANPCLFLYTDREYAPNSELTKQIKEYFGCSLRFT
jgi:hypothetical protein